MLVVVVVVVVVAVVVVVVVAIVVVVVVLYVRRTRTHVRPFLCRRPAVRRRPFFHYFSNLKRKKINNIFKIIISKFNFLNIYYKSEHIL